MPQLLCQPIRDLLPHMRLLRHVFVLLLLWSALFDNVTASGCLDRDLLVVSTENGPFRGGSTTLGREWLGVPYAAPPVSSLRWAAPQPPMAQSEIRNATSLPPACPQLAGYGGLWNITKWSEDCLYLNIYVPFTKNCSLLPVMVWLHGGGFQVGSGSEQLYNGTLLAYRSGAIVVTVTYRLGILGFLAHPALLNSVGSSGNWGLLDQAQALQWIQRNVVKFGGNPKMITLFGQSAGGIATLLHLFFLPTKGLFQRAIIESGSDYQVLPTLSDMLAAGERAVNATTNCTAHSDVAACLRSLSVSAVLALQSLSLYPTVPLVDELLMPCEPLACLATNQTTSTKVPLLVGTTEQEYTFNGIVNPSLLTMNSSTVDTIIEYCWPENFTAIESLYPSVSFALPFVREEQIATDLLAHCTLRNLSLLLTASTSGYPVYLYHFTYTPSFSLVPLLGSYHTSELPFVFMHPCFVTCEYETRSFSAQDLQVSDSIIDFWASFASLGKPSSSWPAFNAESMIGLLINANSSLASFSERNNCNFWAQVPPTQCN